MKRKLATVGLTLGLSLFGAVLVGGSPASATGTNGSLCLLNGDAWMYNWPITGDHIADVHAGHYFRVHGYYYDLWNRLWYYGHSGENPAQDGFVLAGHVNC